jgi:uncharacterized membrane protein
MMQVSTPTNLNSTIAPMPAGVDGVVLNGPYLAGGRQWYRVRTANSLGWVPQDWLVQATKFAPGDSVRSTRRMMQVSTPTNLNSTIAPMPAGVDGVVLNGPYFAGARLWYQVRTSGSLGWVAQDWLVHATKFDVGDSFRVTGKVTALTTPGDFSTAVTPLPARMVGVILSGPEYAGGRLWWQTDTSQGVSWSPQDWLEPV